MDAYRTNDTEPPSETTNAGTCAHGQAALLLVETLMHALVAKGTISREDFIEIVDGAAEVELELAIAHVSPPCDRTVSLLSPMAAAFAKELGR
jgi:hypothetical protein